MKLSVIVPIYNVEKYVEKCVRSIMGQTLSDIQIILVDDGSKDLSGQICDDLARVDERIVVIHKENGGLVSARKAGLEQASGDYVTFVDGDDWIDVDFYKKAFDINAENYDMLALAYTDEYEHYSSPQRNRINDGVYMKTAIQKEILPYLIYFNQIKQKNILFSPGLIPGVVVKVVKREIALDAIMRLDNRISMGEDLAATALMLDRVESLRIASDINGYHYMRNGESMTRELNLDKGNRFEVLYQFMVNNCSVQIVKNIPIHALNVLYGNYRLAMGKSCKANIRQRIRYIDCFIMQDYMEQVLGARAEVCEEMNLTEEYVKFFDALAKRQWCKTFVSYLFIRRNEKRG